MGVGGLFLVSTLKLIPAIQDRYVITYNNDFSFDIYIVVYKWFSEI
jgi:hypothetical protein